MKNLVKEKANNKIIFLILIPVILIICIGISLLNYHPFSKNNTLANTFNNILQINNRSSEFLSDETIEVEKALKILPVMRTELIKISTSISTEPTSFNSDPKTLEILQKGITQNILVIEQIEGLLNNPHGSDVILSADNLKIYRDTADSYYSLLCSENTHFNLGESLYSAINATIDFCISDNNTKKSVELKNKQNELFINEFNELVISLNTLKTDFSSKIDDYRNNKITYELLLSNINDCSNKITSVKSVMSSTNIPDNFSSIFNDFSEIVNLYSDYLFNLKYNFVTENVRRKKNDIDSDFLNTLYKSSDDILESFDNKYLSFIKKYKALEAQR